MSLRTLTLALFTTVALAAGGVYAQAPATPCAPEDRVMASQLIRRGERAGFDLTALSSRPPIEYVSAGGWEDLRVDGARQEFRLSIAVDARALGELNAGGAGFRGLTIGFAKGKSYLTELKLQSPSGKTVTLLSGRIQRPIDGRAIALSPLSGDDFRRAEWYAPAEGATTDWSALDGETVQGEWQIIGSCPADVRSPLQLTNATLQFDDRARDQIVAPDGVLASGAQRFSARPAASQTFRFRVVNAAGCTREYAYPVQIESDCRFRVQRVAERLPSCPGAADGRLAFVALGAPAGVTYDLSGRQSSSGAFTGLAAGDYLLTVRGADECIVEQAVTLVERDRGFVTADWLATSCSPARYEARLSPRQRRRHRGGPLARRGGLRF